MLIVDDEPLAAERSQLLCAGIAGCEVVGVVGDGRTAVDRIGELAPDVVLLDISMPHLDGLALARIVTADQHPPAIIFVTAHSRYAVQAFELAVTDYLLKPVSSDRLRQALGRAAEGRQRRSTQASGLLTEIWAPRGRSLIRLGVDALDLLEAERDYVRLHADGQSYLVRTTLQHLESRLDPQRFMRVHRSVLVPRDRVRGLKADATGRLTVSLSTGRDVRVGRSFQSAVRRLAVGLGSLSD